MSKYELISITISVIALLSSITQWICSFISKRTNIKVQLLKNYINESGLNILFEINNNSSNPVSITSMVINKTYKCVINKMWIGERYYPTFPETDIPRTERIFSAQLPINLQPHQSWIGVIIFENIDIKVNNDTNFNLLVNTNKRNKRFNLKFKDASDIDYFIDGFNSNEALHLMKHRNSQ